MENEKRTTAVANGMNTKKRFDGTAKGRETENGNPLRPSAVCISALISMALLWLLAAGPARAWMLERFGAVNLPALAMAVALCMVLLIFFGWVGPLFSGRARVRHGGVFGMGLAALFAGYLLIATILQHYTFGAGRNFLDRYPLLLRIVLIGLCAGIALSVVQKYRLLQTENSRWNLLETAVIVLLVLLSFYAAYKPNVLNVGGGNLYHFHAYFNSIYQLFHGQYFFEGLTSIYGHYAFFFLPLYKIMRLLVGAHNEMLLVIMALAALHAVSVLLYAYVLRVFIRNRLVRILGLAAVCAAQLSMESNLYVQTYPHRTFPYAVLAALLALWFSKKDKRRLIGMLGYAVCAVIVVWSTECGAVCAVTWAALHCCAALHEKGLLPWARVLAHLGALGASLAGGYVLTCCFNLLCGGAWIPVPEFLFPLMTESYMTGFLEEPLDAFPAAWAPIAATLLCFLGLGLSGTVLCTRRPEQEPSAAVYFALGVLGLGTLTYAFNRPTYGNFYIMLPLMAVLMCLLVQQSLPRIRSLLENGIPPGKTLSLWEGFCGGAGVTLLSVLLLLGIFSAANYGAMQEKRQPYRDLYSLEYMREYCEQTASPEEFTAVGRGALEICASRGWDNVLPVMDYSDITISPKHLAYADSLLAALDDQCVLFEVSAFETHEESGLPGFRHFMQHHTQTETVVPPSEVSDLLFYYFVPAA